jgi:3',5'-cyclic AMP phosphodiesterase CpdA
MRIVATADIHYAEQWEPAFSQLSQSISDENPDVLLIAGDLGEPLASFEAALALFDHLSCPKGVVAGNHDVWHRDGPYTSQQLWEEVLPDAVRRSGSIWLEEENIVVDDVGICGTVGWYDYSGRDPSLGFSPEEYESLKGLVNLDARYIDWPHTDREFANGLRQHFIRRLEELDTDPRVQQIVVITHVPVFEECVLRKPDDVQWNFGNAYFANLALGRAIVTRRKVSLVVSGHRHVGGEWEINFGGNALQVYIVDSDYGRPAYLTLDL